MRILSYQGKIETLCTLRLERPTGAGERKRQLKIKRFISRPVAYAPSSPQRTQRKIEDMLVTRIVRKLNSAHTSCPFGAEVNLYPSGYAGLLECIILNIPAKTLPSLCPLRLERPQGAGVRKRQLKIKRFISRPVAYAPSSQRVHRVIISSSEQEKALF